MRALSRIGFVLVLLGSTICDDAGESSAFAGEGAAVEDPLHEAFGEARPPGPSFEPEAMAWLAVLLREELQEVGEKS